MRSRWTVVLTFLAIAAFATLLTLWCVFVDLSKEQYAALVMKHFQAIIGLPMAAIAAFVVVAHLRQRSGEGLEFKALGFQFKGPSGEVVLWLICFLSIAGAIKLLW